MYFRRQVQIYLHSFKRLDKKFLYNVLWSFALVLIFLGIILLFVLFMRNNLSPAISVLSPLMKAVQAEEDSTAGQQALIMLLAQNKELITETITKSVIGLVVTLVALLLVILMFGSVIWSNILRQKHGLLFLRRFAAVSFIWIILSLGVVSLALFLFKLKVGIVLGVILLLAFMYLKLGINLNFSKEKKILKNLGSFKKGFTRFHLMIIPFIFIFTTFVLLVISSLALLSLGNSVYRILIGIVLIFLLLSFVNWTRFYLVKVNSTDSQ
jgi:hypothetical protein